MVATTASEWSPAERLVSGAAPKLSATRPPVDVQSVLCGAASNRIQVLRKTAKAVIEKPITESLDLLGSPCKKG